MNFLYSNPMPVADHFLALGPLPSDGNVRVDGRAAAPSGLDANGHSAPSGLDANGHSAPSGLDANGHSAAPGWTADHDDDELTAVPPAFVVVCETCHAYFADQTELWRHARDQHGEDRRLRCRVADCDRRFFAAAMCASHSERHRGGGGGGDHLTCELCGRHARDAATYDRHVAKAHPKAVAAVCAVCHLYAGDVRSLVVHVRRRHGRLVTSETAAAEPHRDGGGTKNRAVVRCDVCGKRFDSNRPFGLYKHMWQVHGDFDGDVARRMGRVRPKSHGVHSPAKV